MTEHVLVLPPGTPIGNDGRYIIQSVLGQGGFGIVYLAKDTLPDVDVTDVVVKEFYPKDIATRSRFRKEVEPRNEACASAYAARFESFCAEAKLLVDLAGYQGVAPIRDAFKYNGTGYIVFNYIQGSKSLAEYLDAKGGRLSWTETAFILTPIAEALQFMHCLYKYHKDVSPSNILVTKRGGVLIDFGSAVSKEVTVKDGYTPDEVYGKSPIFGSYSDVYSLAATAYKCITGITPPKATDRRINDTLLPPSAVGVDIPPEVETVLMSALASWTGGRAPIKDLLNIFNGKYKINVNKILAEIDSAKTQKTPTETQSEPKATAPAQAVTHAAPEQPTPTPTAPVPEPDKAQAAKPVQAANADPAAKTETQAASKSDAAKTASSGTAARSVPKPTPASADGPTVVLYQEYISKNVADGEVTVVLDCSKMHDLSDFTQQSTAYKSAQPLRSVDTEKASAVLKESGEKFGKAAGQAGEQLGKAASQAGQQLGKAAGQAGEKISEAIKSNPAKFKKIAIAVVALLVILVGGYTYYNTVYLNSFGVQYGKALDMYDSGDYRMSFAQLDHIAYMYPNPNDKELADINYLRVLLLFKGYTVEDDDFLGTLSKPDDYIEFSKKLADAGDLRHMTMLAELCFMGSVDRHEMFYQDIGFNRLKKYADTIAEKDPDYQNMSRLNQNIADRLFIIAMDKLDKSIVEEAVGYMKKAGASDSNCAQAREKYNRMIQRRIEDQQAKKEIAERKRKQREADRKAKLEHEAWLREQKEKDRIAAEQNRKAREERKRQEAAAKKANQQKQQAQKKSQTAKSAAKPKTTVQKQQPKTQQKQQPQNISGMTLSQKITAVRKAMAQRDANEQARLRKKAEQEAAAKGISVNDALMILLGIGR